jgi:UDP-GlcNAc:undecaprenyl-phosphate GlcNAc-1-phosphate transferase
MLTYFGYLLLAAVLSASLSAASIWFSRRYGLFDHPSVRKRHAAPMPHFGGVAIFTSFIAVFVFAAMRSDAVTSELAGQLPAVIAACLVVFVTGLIDDIRPLGVIAKLTGQLVAAMLIIAAGFVIPRFHVPFWSGIELGWVSYPVTALWIVTLSNSINLIDGLDGLAGSVSIVVCFGLLITGILLGVDAVVLISICAAGAIAGFLPFNLSPAKLFMGDSGALFLGFVFSLVAVICPIKSYTAAAMFVPILAVGVPVIEVIVSFFRRTLSGQRFYVGDNRHIYNVLQEFGLSQRRTVILLSIVSLAFTAFIPALFWFDRRAVFSIFVIFVLILLGSFLVLKLRRNRGQRHGKPNGGA